MKNKTQQELATELNVLTIEMKAIGKKMAALLKQRKPRKSSKEEIKRIDMELSILNEESAKMNKRSLEIMELQGYKPDNSASKASSIFHEIMAASVKVNPNTKEKMEKIDLDVFGKKCTFNYTISKTSDQSKKDRYWDFHVSHNNDGIDQIPKSFSFRHDTFNNITEGKIGTFIEYVCEQIMMKELS